MIHPFFAFLSLAALSWLAALMWRDMLRAAPPPMAGDGAEPEQPWLLLFVQAGSLALLFLVLIFLSFGYSPR